MNVEQNIEYVENTIEQGNKLGQNNEKNIEQNIELGHRIEF